ncbi:MAG: multidrug effflux MFS transporter [Magnetovibrio sp.]|nr:multidrug effflux MFS transporter [Magnetovibrio sp.]
MRLEPRSFGMAALLTSLVAIAPISTDMYLPSMPAIGAYFHASTAEVQLTLSVFLLGFAGAQLAWGPLSDRFGRRPVLITGTVIFVLSSIACSLSLQIEQLIIARFFQAIGACAGGAVGRAAVRDIHETKDAARLLAHMGTAMAIAPLVAPLLGGQLTFYFGWSTNFTALACVGAIVLFFTALTLPETNRQLDEKALAPRRIIANYSALLAHPEFRAYTFANAFSFSGLFAFISGSSFVLIGTFGLTAQTFGFAFSAPVLGYMAGTQIGARLVKRMSLPRLVHLGGLMGVIAGATGLAAVMIYPSIPTVIGPMFLYTCAVGIVMPNSMAGSIGPFPHMAGAASALMGFIQMALAATMGALFGIVHDGTAVPMMAIIAMTGLIGFLFARTTKKFCAAQ